jgi:hypothetical protein
MRLKSYASYSQYFNKEVTAKYGEKALAKDLARFSKALISFWRCKPDERISLCATT